VSGNARDGAAAGEARPRSSSGGPSAARRAANLFLLALAAGTLLLAWCLRPAGGLRGLYAISGPEGRDLAVHERIDPRIDFPVPQAIDAAYIFHWDVERLGFPYQMPVYVVRWRGVLRVPREGRYAFAIDARGEASLRLDGRPIEVRPDALTETALLPGWHPIEIDYRLRSGEARLILRWQPPGGRLQVVPSRHLAVDPAAADRAGARRAAGWCLALLACVFALLAPLAARREGSAAARAWALLAPQRTRIALGAILLLAAFLRFHDYALVPFHHETADEYQHAWEGWSLLHEGVPVAWSTFPDHYPLDQTRDLKWFGDRYVLVRPYFDHPPLFSLLVGLVNSLAGARSQWACTLPVMRLVPIILSLAGLLLLGPLARAYGASERAALWAALVYAALPLIVATHRLVKAESLLAILFMGAILAVERYEWSRRRAHALLAGALCGLSLWSKATGVAVVAVVLVLLLSRRRYRAALVVLGTSAAFLGLYLLYAAAYDFRIFLEVIRAQATTKWVGLDGLLDLLGGKVAVKWFGRGWYLWLLLCAGVVAWRRERALLLPIAVYVVVIALTADQRVIYGWYRVPLYPFLCVAAGVYLEEMIREADLFRVFPFAATAAATGVLYALPETLARAETTAVAFAALALAPFLLRLAHPRPATERLARGAAWLLLAVFLVTCVAVVRDLLPIYAASRGVR
jgi:hypothetical protein